MASSESGTERMTGWWSVASTSAMRPEHYDQVRDLLQSAHERGEEVVAVDGITFTWHPVDEMTEDRIRAEAIASERARIVAAVEGLHGVNFEDTEDQHIDRAAVLAIIDGAS